MPGIVKLYTQFGQLRKRFAYYSIDDRKAIINLWKEQYEDAVIQIAPGNDLKGEGVWEERVMNARKPKTWFENVYGRPD